MEDFLEQMRNDHKDFDHGSLEGNFGSQPFELFSTWFSEAIETKQVEPNAFVLSTVSQALQTSSRILYLKEVLNDQFVFYTNYNSHKGTDLMHNNNASMLFFWPNLQRQVRIEGSCSKVPSAVSDAYFATRPRASQIGAWASNQSEKLEDRSELEQRVEAFALQFPTEVPRPPHWGGYALLPTKVEFWQGRPSRLHDRIVFEQNADQWEIYRMNP
jgi:pyridoxamine 5'-phosphate oxidase